VEDKPPATDADGIALVENGRFDALFVHPRAVGATEIGQRPALALSCQPGVIT